MAKGNSLRARHLGSQHCLPAAMQERQAFRPPGGTIGEREPCTGSHLGFRHHSGPPGPVLATYHIRPLNQAFKSAIPSPGLL